MSLRSSVLPRRRHAKRGNPGLANCLRRTGHALEGDLSPNPYEHLRRPAALDRLRERFRQFGRRAGQPIDDEAVRTAFENDDDRPRAWRQVLRGFERDFRGGQRGASRTATKLYGRSSMVNVPAKTFLPSVQRRPS